jgi:AAA+ ATPase superfamily predicted ATPase
MIIQNFKNREGELETLKTHLNSNKFELLIIYERRRIGKIELISQATKDMKRIYYLATTRKNLERFYSLALSIFQKSQN